MPSVTDSAPGGSTISQAKKILALPELMRRLGLGDHAKKSARCPFPFHDDQHNSFSVWQKENGAWRFKCHAGCGAGDEIDFLEVREGLSNSAAVKRFLEIAGMNGSKPHWPASDS